MSHEACSLLSFLRNASVMHPNHMSNYIYCVYVSKMHRKRFFYEVTTHLILFFEQTFPLKIKSLLLPLITPCYLLDACILTYSPTHDVIVCKNAVVILTDMTALAHYYYAFLQTFSSWPQ